MIEDIPRTGIWKRLLLGAFLVIVASATASAVAAFHEVDKVVSALHLNPELKGVKTQLAVTSPGDPQTILLLGSDRRPPSQGGGGARSDTILLIRLDPSKNSISMMSLPRDLKVNIPGHGVAKINAAYDYGGPPLTLKTVKEVTGLRINHVINVDFRGFYSAVNAIGCVYTDIDRRYYNNTPGYAFIDVQPGYQKMCGRQALQYVRFRHEDNDLVRSARQQNFLREAKQQIGLGKLIANHDKLVKIFGRYTTSDIRSRTDVLRLLKLAVFSVGAPVREVHFEGQIGPSYVTASTEKVKQLAQQFLKGEDTKGPRGTLVPKGGRRGGGGGGDLGLEKAPGPGKEQAVSAVQQGAGRRLPVFYPTVRTSGSLFAGPPRVYKLRGSNGKVYGAYRIVIKRGLVGEYYGIQGLTWRHPPILEKTPFDKVRIGRRNFFLHYDGDRVRLVAWYTPKAVYWLSNTLLLSLSKRQMLAIARSTRTL